MRSKQASHKAGETCPRCEIVHRTGHGGPACVAHSARTGAACRKSPIVGGNVCSTHGGRAPQAKRAATARVAARAIVADAEALLAAEGISGVDDPVAEIGRLAVEALALKASAGARANALTDIRYTGGLQRDERGELVGTGTEQLRAEVALYERALDRSMKFLEIVVKHTGKQDVDDTNAMLRRLGTALGVGQSE